MMASGTLVRFSILSFLIATIMAMQLAVVNAGEANMRKLGWEKYYPSPPPPPTMGAVQHMFPPFLDSPPPS